MKQPVFDRIISARKADRDEIRDYEKHRVSGVALIRKER
jgi:hypothetical protein